MTRCTSKAAYLTVREDGRELTQAQKIYDIIGRRANMSLSEIQQEYENRHSIRIDKGTVSARVNKMKSEDVDAVAEDLPRKCLITGKTVNPVYVKAGQNELF